MEEFEKYKEIYSGKIGESYVSKYDVGYGRGFWGEGAIDFILSQNPKSVLDVGCGYGRFCDAISEKVEKVYGLDIASVITHNVIENNKINFIHGEAKKIPLDDNSIEWITSFDCLEHCLPQDIDEILNEFNRVSTKGWVFSISYSSDSFDGLQLHMTVNPEKWWLDKISKYGKIERGNYITNMGYQYIILKK